MNANIFAATLSNNIKTLTIIFYIQYLFVAMVDLFVMKRSIRMIDLTHSPHPLCAWKLVATFLNFVRAKLVTKYLICSSSFTKRMQSQNRITIDVLVQLYLFLYSSINSGFLCFDFSINSSFCRIIFVH